MSTGPTNFNQPQSLVKYSNPVLVSSSGKKQVKVTHPLPRTPNSTPKTSPTPTPKTSSTPSYPHDNTPPKNNNFGTTCPDPGSSQSQQHPPRSRMSSIFRKNLTKDYSKDKLERQESVQSAKNCTVNVSMN